VWAGHSLERFARRTRDKIQQVLLNIVDNALKFTPSGGIIELAVFSEGRHTVAITVRDTGQGIAPEALPYVFDRFYRADPTRSRRSSQKSGNGLGLAIAKELVEAQRGTILIDSTLGKGTTVTIRFPGVDEEF
jgi:signal transduction histidine kinase